jgi:hypothetical protein
MTDHLVARTRSTITPSRTRDVGAAILLQASAARQGSPRWETPGCGERVLDPVEGGARQTNATQRTAEGNLL